MNCEHEYRHIETIKRDQKKESHVSLKKVDRFFCKKCLIQKEVVNQGLVYFGESYPDWWQGRSVYDG